MKAKEIKRNEVKEIEQITFETFHKGVYIVFTMTLQVTNLNTILKMKFKLNSCQFMWHLINYKLCDGKIPNIL